MANNVTQTNYKNGTINDTVTTYAVTNKTTDAMEIANCIPVSSSTSKVNSGASKIYIPPANWSKVKGNKSTRYGDNAVNQQNQNKYPVIAGSYNGSYNYDYNINIQKEITQAIKEVKMNLNIPSAYNRLELNKLFHEKFNRFRIQYPDYFMNGTVAYVVMTRPDLNLFSSGCNKSDLLDQVLNDPQLYYIVNADFETAQTLVKAYSSAHHFNPLLSNTLTSLDISDESIDTLETGETFTGFKTQYAKSNIRSMTAGTINLKFPETFNMSITHAHQLWCNYESSVYRGSLKPKDKYIWNKELDYACDIYYFLLDKEDMIIRYWCKYTGCFPLNVNKSIFSYDVGTDINHPEVSVTYAYFSREDMSAITLNEFNNNSGGKSLGFKYRSNYIPSLDAAGNTWANAPFVEAITRNTGMDRDAKLFALRFRE